MRESNFSETRLRIVVATFVIAFAAVLWSSPVHAQQASQTGAPTPTPSPSPNAQSAGTMQMGQSGDMNQTGQSSGTMTAGQTGMDEEVAHPFFTHMGMPEGVGVYSLRLSGLANRSGGRTNGDFAFHFETGLTKNIGIHVRNDNFLNMPRTEVMFQFAAIKSKSGMSGFAPIIEFEIPTRRGGRRIETLVGYTVALANTRAAFNHVVHYNPRMSAVDSSGAIVFKLGTRFYPVVELLGQGARGERPIVRLLGGLKVRVNKNLMLGFAVQAPVTSRKDYSSQSVFQSDIGWSRAR